MLVFNQTFLANHLVSLLQLVLVRATKATVAKPHAAIQLENYLLFEVAM